MDASTLSGLPQAKDLTLAQLRETNPLLATAIEEAVRSAARSRVLETLTEVPEDVRARVAGMDLSHVAPADVGEHLRTSLTSAGVDAGQAGALADRIHQAELANELRPDQPIGSHPDVALLVEKARLLRVGTLAGLSESAAQTLADRLASPAAVTEEALENLVRDSTLTEAQAQAVGFATALQELTGGEIRLAQAILTARFEALGGRTAAGTRDLAALRPADWDQFLAQAGIPSADGTSRAALAATLASRFAAIHPSAAFAARLPTIEIGSIENALQSLAPLFAHNAAVVETGFDSLDTEGLSATQIGTLRQAHDELRRLVNSYPGLELARVLDDSALAPGDKAEVVARRVGLIRQITDRLGEVNLLRFDYSPGSPDLARLTLPGLDLNADEQRMIVAMFKAYQRVWTLTQNIDDAHSLVAAGFSSAMAMGTQSFAKFSGQAPLDSTKARAVWEQARTRVADTTLTAGSVMDIFHGRFDDLRVGNTLPSATDYLKSLAGFQDMFGNLSFCDCQECQSILGPAAYFVDLMKFVDENLRDQFDGHPNHPLDLHTRRPDLWELELTCANTNTRIPTLDIVNEILENNIAQRLGYGGSWNDRVAIEDFVYKQTLAQHVDSFGQPFHLPLVRIAAYLAAPYLARLSHTRAEVADVVGAPAATRTCAILDLSPREYELISTPNTTLEFLSTIYSTAFGIHGAALDPIDVQVLIAATGLPREQVGSLAATHFVAAGGAVVSIRAEKRDPANSVQNDIERVHGLTADALDRMHRLTRLARKVTWSIDQLDLVLTTLGDSTLAAGGLDAVATVSQLQGRLGATVEELCALVGPLPQLPAGQSLFDRLFNPPSFVAANGAFPQDKTQFIHPAFHQTTPAPADPALPRLLSALRVDLDGLATLARHLAPHLAQETTPGFNPDDPDESKRYFVLSAANLTLLYRHARLATLLGLSLDDLFQLLGLGGLDPVAGAGDLSAALDLHNWRRQSGYELDDVARATGQAPRNPTRYPDPAGIAAQVIAAAATGLTFKGTVFAVALGTTEQASRDLLTANPNIIEAQSEDMWRLKADIIDLSTASITVPPSATVPTPPAGTRAVTDDEVRTVLQPYQASEVAGRALGATLGLPLDKLRALAKLANRSLDDPDVVRAVRGDGPADPLADLVAALIPLLVAFRAPAWDAAALDFVRQNPDRFSGDPLPRVAAATKLPYLSVTQLRALSVYARLAGRALGSGPDAPTVNPADVQLVLTQFDPAVPGFPAAADAAIARVLGVGVGLVVGLRGRLELPAVAAPALDRLDRAAQVAHDIGIDGEALSALVSDDYATLARAAEASLAALRAGYSDEKQRAQALDDAEGPIRGRKRDALADYLIHSLNAPVFETLDDLYSYFLIDVAVDGCATTSRVVAAISSVQLYVYRVLMHLEQDNLERPDHVALYMPAEAAAEWGWRQNYRVWQANRKVFLWPENYLEPDLRDDKTPLFEELEQQLLQTDISDQNVLDAYATYLKGFQEVASLTIAGAYQDVRQQGDQTVDVLHLFGVTADDPPVYYYRTCQNLIAGWRNPTIPTLWSPWQKINVQITARRVSPVVYLGRLQVFWTDIKTRPLNKVENGTSTFVGYQHTMSMSFTTLRADGTWSPPQAVVLPAEGFFSPGSGTIRDLLDNNGKPKFDTRKHTEPIDDYGLSGPNWEWIWLEPSSEKLYARYRDFLEHGSVDLFLHRATDLISDPPSSGPYPQLLCARGIGNIDKSLYYGTPLYIWVGNRNTHPNLVIDESRIDVLFRDGYPSTWVRIPGGLYTEQIATLPAQVEMLAIPGSVEDGIFQVGVDMLLLQGSVTDDSSYILRRLGTTLAEDVARRLFMDGIDGLLDIRAQYQLAEAVALAPTGAPIRPVGPLIVDRSNSRNLDFKGPYGVYYRELFFHIPFLIANALNSRGRFAAAQRWYHYIFDPTSTEVIVLTPDVPPEERAHRLLDRVWRYREFRNLNLEHLRDVLTDEVALGYYKTDPFNPHAIARRRISAYQKAVVMKYVDNLLDWADSLFTQFTQESVNEALMLYVMASDVLGPRPAQLGDCGEGNVDPKTYEKIGPLVDSSSEILIELESWMVGRGWGMLPAPAPSGRLVLDPISLHHAVGRYPILGRSADARADGTSGPSDQGSVFRGLDWKNMHTESWAPALANASVASPAPWNNSPPESLAQATGGASNGSTSPGSGGASNGSTNPGSGGAIRDSANQLLGRVETHARGTTFAEWAGRFGWCIIRQITPVFCIPPNQELLAYWDRVEAQLNKIRHCQDITGTKRELPLFPPEIPPDLLVRMRAAGLTLEDILNATSGDLPPYRFLYLIDRAKAFAATLSGFGTSLLAALEKKDAEELSRLRLLHETNLMRMTTQLRKWEMNAAEDTTESLSSQRDAAAYRQEFFGGLISQERNAREAADSNARKELAGIYQMESILQLYASLTSAIPNAGSPFAMTFGGVQLSAGWARFGNMIAAVAHGIEGTSSSTALEGSFDRRTEDWRHQRELASRDIQILDKQIKAAEIRRDMAERSLELHQKSLDQLDELHELMDGKFTNLGLYTWLSTQLQRLYRDAYQSAMSLAKLAEQAFRFERGDDTSAGLAPSYWDPTRSGLLAGERLLLDLQNLERRYLETNYRTLEVDQAFALSQVDPQALLDLKETGECEFEVSELFFDLYYPGHYKRRIKAARLTIPCITGPYTNVSATFTLIRSWIRTTPAENGALVEVPPRRSISIATSTAQNDAGVFELSFRDERYMPFEGAGAISRWKLTLPKTFKQFDYQTINDVILSISYTADQDGALRDRVESQIAATEGALLAYFGNNSVKRVFSLRQEFSSAFTRLVRSPVGTAVQIEITDRHFPFFAKNRTIRVDKAILLLRTTDGATAAGVKITVDSTVLDNFVAQGDSLGKLPGEALPAGFTSPICAQHTLTVDVPGDLASATPSPGDNSAIDADKLQDVLIYLEYGLS